MSNQEANSKEAVSASNESSTFHQHQRMKNRPPKLTTDSDEFPLIKTTTSASTAGLSSQGSLLATGSRSTGLFFPAGKASFSPSTSEQNEEPIIVWTPAGQRIQASYEDLGLTPTMKLPISDAVRAINDDGVWEGEDKNGLVYRLLVFLYGKGYYQDLPKDKRVKKIQKLVSNQIDDTENGQSHQHPLYRLKQLAISDESRVLLSEQKLRCYEYMAGTALEIFSHEKNLGGFPVRPYCRYQGSNNCYHVSAAMFLTLELQKQNGQQQRPLDTGYIGRRHVIDDVEGLEKRVLDNKGDFADDICSKVCGENIFDTIHLTSFTERSAFIQSRSKSTVVHYAQEGSFAIVSIKTTKNFRDVNTKTDATNNYGYWKFEEVEDEDVDHEDVEGTFVDLNDAVNENMEILSQLEKLKEEWERQKNERESAVKSRRHYENQLSSFFPEKSTETESSNKDEEKQNSLSEGTTKASDSNENPDPDDTESTSARHSMVLLGYIYQGDGMYHTPDDYLYVMWNWWPNAPLIIMSFDYLVACNPIINYNSKKQIKIGGDIKNCDYLATEASEPTYSPEPNPHLFVEVEETGQTCDS